jgi:hypothetical protein
MFVYNTITWPGTRLEVGRVELILHSTDQFVQLTRPLLNRTKSIKPGQPKRAKQKPSKCSHLICNRLNTMQITRDTLENEKRNNRLNRK